MMLTFSVIIADEKTEVDSENTVGPYRFLLLNIQVKV